MNCLKSSVKLKLLWQFHSVMPPPLSLPIRSHALFYTLFNTALSLTIALFFATHSARVLSVRNIDSSLFLSLSLCLWFQVILNKDFANLENLVWTSKRVFCCYIFSPKETAQNSKPALACSTHTHKLTRSRVDATEMRLLRRRLRAALQLQRTRSKRRFSSERKTATTTTFGENGTTTTTTMSM